MYNCLWSLYIFITHIYTHESIGWKDMYPWGYFVEGYVFMREMVEGYVHLRVLGWKDMYHEGMYPEENVYKDLFLIFQASGCILFSSHTPRWNKNNCPFLPETCLVFIFIIIQYMCIKNLCPKNCLCHKFKYSIPISLQPDGVNLWYFKFRFLDLTEFLLHCIFIFFKMNGKN